MKIYILPMWEEFFFYHIPCVHIYIMGATADLPHTCCNTVLSFSYAVPFPFLDFIQY